MKMHVPESKRIMSLLIMLLTTSFIFAQVTVTGNVRDEKGDEVADIPIKQSNFAKIAPEEERRLADRPAERTSLQEKLAAMKARVSGTPAGRDAVDKAKGKDQIL